MLKDEVNDQAAGEALAAIARQEDLNGRIRRNVMDTRRAVSFMMRARMLNADQFEEARQILRTLGASPRSVMAIFMVQGAASVSARDQPFRPIGPWP